MHYFLEHSNEVFLRCLPIYLPTLIFLTQLEMVSTKPHYLRNCFAKLEKTTFKMSSIFVVVAYNLRRRQADSRQVGKMVVVVENYFIFLLLLVQLTLSN